MSGRSRRLALVACKRAPLRLMSVAWLTPKRRVWPRLEINMGSRREWSVWVWMARMSLTLRQTIVQSLMSV